MTTTAKTALNATTWTELSADSENVLVQLISEGRCGICVAAATPSGAWDDYHILGSGEDSVGFSSLTTGDNVYGLAQEGTVNVVVTKT